MCCNEKGLRLMMMMTVLDKIFLMNSNSLEPLAEHNYAKNKEKFTVNKNVNDNKMKSTEKKFTRDNDIVIFMQK